jgi:hypothetical protein
MERHMNGSRLIRRRRAVAALFGLLLAAALAGCQHGSDPVTNAAGPQTATNTGAPAVSPDLQARINAARQAAAARMMKMGHPPVASSHAGQGGGTATAPAPS